MEPDFDSLRIAFDCNRFRRRNIRQVGGGAVFAGFASQRFKLRRRKHIERKVFTRNSLVAFISLDAGDSLVAFISLVPFIPLVALGSSSALVAFLTRVAFLARVAFLTGVAFLARVAFLTGVAFELRLHFVGEVNGDVGVISFDDNINAGPRHQSKRALVADAKAVPVRA